MAVKTTNTFSEWLQKLVAFVQQGKLLPDAIGELPWITSLETEVLQKAHEVIGNEESGNTSIPAGGGPPPGPQGPPMQGPPPGGGVPNSMMGSPQMPPPEVMAQLMQQGQGGAPQ